MSTVATRYTKFQVGAAAAALTAAAVFTPAAIAQAKPELMPTTPVSQIFSTNLFGTDPIQGPAQLPLDNAFCFSFDPTCDAFFAAATSSGTTVLEFTPLSLVPGFLKPVVGWFLNLVPRVSICLGGLGVSIGPYATLSIKTGAC